MSNQKPKDKAEKYAARTRVFSSEAREAIANDYINGYTQALSDVVAVIDEMIKEEKEQLGYMRNRSNYQLDVYVSNKIQSALTQLKNKLKK